MRAVKEVRDKLGSPNVPIGPPPGPVQKVTSAPARFRQFLHDVRMEMRNVTWPNWNDVKSTTTVVVIATFFFGFYLGVALDVPLSGFTRWLLNLGKDLVR